VPPGLIAAAPTADAAKPRDRGKPRDLIGSGIPASPDCGRFDVDPHRGSRCDAQGRRNGTTRSVVHVPLVGRKAPAAAAGKTKKAMQSNCCSCIGQLGSMSRSGARSGHSTSQAQTGLPLAGSSCQRHSRTGRRRRSAALRRSDWRIFEDACPTCACTACRRSKVRTFAVLANIAHLRFPRLAAGR
jgi:hypothetical protein